MITVIVSVHLSTYKALSSDLPEELFWRLHFAMGSFVFSMASSQALTEIAESDFHKHVDIKVIQHLVPFVAQELWQIIQARSLNTQLKKSGVYYF